MIEGVQIDHGTHVCGLYASDLGRIRLAVSFLLDGLGRDGACFLVAEPRIRDGIVAHLEAAEEEPGRHIEDGRLVLSEYGESAGAQLEFWTGRFADALAAGARSIRVVGDMWSFGQALGPAGLVEYEAAYERLIAERFPVVTLCAYDARRFTGVQLVDALKGHPHTFRYPFGRTLA